MHTDHNKISTFLFALMVAVLVLPAAAQECSFRGMAGTWAFRYTGASFQGGPPSPVTLHSIGAFMLGTQMGTLTVNADGTVLATAWTAMGPYRFVVTDSPGKITSIGLQKTAGGEVLGCAMTLEYASLLPTDPPTVDQMFVTRNGKDGWGMHISPVVPFTNSIAVCKRISRSADPAPRCGPQTLRGTYVLQCSAPMYTADGKTLASATMFHLTVSAGGVTKGTSYHRVATNPNEVSVHGVLSANPDCTGQGYLYMTGLLPDPAIEAKVNNVFVTYDQGKGGFLMPLEIEVPNSAKVPYPSPVSCTMERSDP